MYVVYEQLMNQSFKLRYKEIIEVQPPDDGTLSPENNN